jgi:hypothetical protein
VFAVPACGGSESSAPTVTGGGGTSSSATSEGAIPSELLGAWTTTLKETDLPADVPPELANAAKWRLEIAETGGTDNGPVLSIVNPDLGQLEGPTLDVAGNRLRLLQEECAASGDTQFFDNEYSYEVQGDILTVHVVKNQCPDRIAETILTSEPWSKAD